MKTGQSIRGMHDILPAATPIWQWLEEQLRGIFTAYDFHEIRVPLLERTDVFTRAIGQATDVVEKEMYTFEDRNGEQLSLRPEGTAGVVRAVIQHGLLQTPGLKVWYQGPMFRYERPQKGRQRQFHQFGAELFGLESAAADVELIAMGEQMWRQLGLSGRVRLNINTLGDREDRARYRQSLLDYLQPLSDQLDADSQRRLQSNPLRIFDSKNEQTLKIMAGAPRLSDSLGSGAREHFAEVCSMLDALGIEYTLNSGLVRGLDYYCRTVFEWVSDDLGAQSAVCAGGRYDDLVALQGGRDTPGIGFALGAERLLDLLRANGEQRSQQPQVFIVSQAPPAQMLKLAERLRKELPGLGVATALGGGSMRAQFKRADRSSARWCVILGESELDRGEVSLKDLRSESGNQETIAVADLPEHLSTLLASRPGD